MFSSDHGDLVMEHHQYYKMSMYEGSSRVPLIIAGPYFRSNYTEPGLASLIDIYPTLLDVTGIKSKTILVSLQNICNQWINNIESKIGCSVFTVHDQN